MTTVQRRPAIATPAGERERLAPPPSLPAVPWRRWAGRALIVALLAVAAVVFLYPAVWLVSASLKDSAHVFDGNLVPEALHPENYARLFAMAPVGQWVVNSALVSFLAASTVTLSSAFVAFGFAYFRFPGRDLLFGLVLASLMLPGAVTMIPGFLIWDALGFNGSLVPLWAGNLFASAFYVFLLRQFFLGLPRELFEASRVDGASYPRMWWSVALPLTLPALVVVFVFELKASWTDLVRPLMFLHDMSAFTLPLGLKAIIDNPSIGGQKAWELLAAGGVIVSVPMVIVFLLGQRAFVDGIATTGSKG
ncbi:MAG: carbohydrate ABC transporter permease [Chloroflexota bacterium]